MIYRRGQAASLILDLLRTRGPMSAAALAKQIHTSQAAASSTVCKLVRKGLVERVDGGTRTAMGVYQIAVVSQ